MKTKKAIGIGFGTLAVALLALSFYGCAGAYLSPEARSTGDAAIAPGKAERPDAQPLSGAEFEALRAGRRELYAARSTVARPEPATPAMLAELKKVMAEGSHFESAQTELLVIERRRGKDTGAADRPRGGELRAKLDGRVVPMPLKHTGVKAQITMTIGAVEVTQQYHNPFDSKIEAVYVFPLPQDAAIREFVMTIGERRIRGIIREREEARKIYLAARRQGHVASLLTQERPNIFTQNVANIEPGKRIDIAITYFHSIPQIDGAYRFTFPMVVGPRYTPSGATDGVGAVPVGARGASGQATEVQYLRPEEITAHDIALEVDLDAGVKIEEIGCRSHVVDIDRVSESRAKVTLSPNDRIPNKDFVLTYRLAGEAVKGGLATFKDETGGYFTLMLQPPASLEDLPDAPREMIFVLDCSGSMNGQPIDAAKRALKNALRRLDGGDTFQVIRFSMNASQFGPRPVKATRANIEKAVRYVDGLRGSGGTRMIEGIRLSLDFPHDPSRFRIVSFMTDGFIGNDRQIIGAVRDKLGASRIFSFGVGSSPNRYLLEGMARVGRGAAAYIPLDARAGEVAEGFYRRIEHPALTDIVIDWGGLEVSDVGPRPLPDLFVGRPVILKGRFKGEGKADVTIRGKMGGKPLAMTVKVDLEEPGQRHRALPAIWARMRIAELHDEMTWSTDPKEQQDSIRDIALEYGLMSGYTSFVAVDSAEKTAGRVGTTVVQPVPVPAGVKYETTVGGQR